MLIHIILGLATAIVVSAFGMKYVEESRMYNDGEDKFMAVVVGCFAGMVYPLTIVGGLIYLGDKKFKEEILEGEEQ